MRPTSIYALAFGAVLALTVAYFWLDRSQPELIHRVPPRTGLAAKVAGGEITEEELVAEDRLALAALEWQIYDLKKNTLKRLARERLLAAEAKRAGLGVEEFVRAKILKGEAAPSSGDLEAFFAEKKIAAADRRDPEMQERMRAFLQTDKREKAIARFVSSRLKLEPVEMYFSRPNLGLDPSDGAAVASGAKEAAVRVTEFSDLRCSACRESGATLQKIQDRFGRHVKVVYRFFPGSGDPANSLASAGVYCAGAQGNSSLQIFRRLVLAEAGDLNLDKLAALAVRAGGSEKKWRECMKKEEANASLRSDVQHAHRLGVRAVPFYFVNDRPVAPPLSEESFLGFVEEAGER